MNDTEVIKAAVGYADGWMMHDIYGFSTPQSGDDAALDDIQNMTKMEKAALAAQLVEQIDSETWQVNVCKNRVDVEQNLYIDAKYVPPTTIKGPNRTMNTLRAAVDFYSNRGE